MTRLPQEAVTAGAEMQRSAAASAVAPAALAAEGNAFRYYDHPAVASACTTQPQRGVREAHLVLEGMHCAACARRIETRLIRCPGIESVRANLARGVALVRWRVHETRLSTILYALHDLGYRAYPQSGDDSARWEKERKDRLRRIGVAGLLGMQVMMIAVALYGGTPAGMTPSMETFFRHLSLVLTLPVLVFAGAPIFAAAWRDVRSAALGMDVPVSLGIGLAFAASTLHTLMGRGPVYYESVCMFIFLLSASRYFEFMARKRAFDATAPLRALKPALATRVLERGRRTEEVPSLELRAGDRVRVLPGARIPVDGRLLSGGASIDEALLTGEAMPEARHPGDPLLAGSLVLDHPVELSVTAVGGATVLSRIVAMSERAMAHKPRFAQLADRAAPWFTLGVAVLAGVVGLTWYWLQPEQWLPVTIAVLVVACPCALSLALPTANAAACGLLFRRNILVRRGGAVEALARSDEVVLDKTGTLTLGRPRLQRVEVLAVDRSQQELLRLASALARHSLHPVARALAGAASGAVPLAAEVRHEAGAGLAGRIDGAAYFLGSEAFIRRHCRAGMELAPQRGMLAVLADSQRILAVFVLEDARRAGARDLIRALRGLGKTVRVMSGDRREETGRLARELGLEVWSAQLSPRHKLERVEALQRSGSCVAMVGDGINDAAVLAGADVSIALGEGADLAQQQGDFIVVGRHAVLERVALCFMTARRTLRIMRQNIAWAVAYNVIAIPLAAGGWVTPWMAAIGMCGSSLLVTANSLRLMRTRPARGRP